jgi:hypothetical protein
MMTASHRPITAISAEAAQPIAIPATVSPSGANAVGVMSESGPI